MNCEQCETSEDESMTSTTCNTCGGTFCEECWQSPYGRHSDSKCGRCVDAEGDR